MLCCYGMSKLVLVARALVQPSRIFDVVDDAPSLRHWKWDSSLPTMLMVLLVTFAPLLWSTFLSRNSYVVSADVLGLSNAGLDVSPRPVVNGSMLEARSESCSLMSGGVSPSILSGFYVVTTVCPSVLKQGGWLMDATLAAIADAASTTEGRPDALVSRMAPRWFQPIIVT